MIRVLLSTAATILLLAAPVAASAATTPAAKPAKPMTKPAAKPMHHASAKPTAARSRDGGSAAVDALNDQSLARAKAGQ